MHPDGNACNGLTGHITQIRFVPGFVKVSLFVKPMEGYIRRLLWALVHLGVIPFEAAHDPWGPQLSSDEFENVGKTLNALAL